MTVQTVAVGTPTLPRVNLLPPEIGEAQRARRIQLMCGAAVLVAVAGVGVVYFTGQGAVSKAQSDLDAAQQRNATLRSQAARLSGVTQVKTQLATAQNTLNTAMGSAVNWSPLLNDLSVSLPGNVWITQLNLQSGTGAAGTPAAPATGVQTGTASPVGLVSMTGTGLSHLDVAATVVFLSKEKGLTGAYFSTSHERIITGASHAVDDFQLTATVTSDALFGRNWMRAGG